jgi:hypothetical protein
MKFDVVTGDTWQGVYLNGILVTQDYQISACALLRNLMDYTILSSKIEMVVHALDEQWLAKQGHLPALFTEVVTL